MTRRQDLINLKKTEKDLFNMFRDKLEFVNIFSAHKIAILCFVGL
jgi:hypothetical protein